MSFTSKPLHHQSHKMSETKSKTKTKFLTTLKASQFRMNQLELGGNIITKNGGESSFRVLYYGDASAGSIPFMWELHPGTPKHANTESTPPPLTPPPALFHHKNNEKYDNNNSLNKQSLRTLFRTISGRKSHVGVSSSDSSISYDSSKQSTSLRSLFLASSSSREVHVPSSSFSLPSTPWTEENGGAGGGGDGDDSPTSTLCFGGGFMNRRKKMKSVIGSHGKMHKKKFISFY